MRFLFGHPAHFLALSGGLGLIPFAPGTFGTLLALPIFWLVGLMLAPALYLAGLTVFFSARHLATRALEILKK
ncbi:MAG: phosphatidylglycerophosphatase A, partial [Pseudomonadota bacterium]